MNRLISVDVKKLKECNFYGSQSQRIIVTVAVTEEDYAAAF